MAPFEGFPAEKDPYAALGVGKGADADKVRAAYRGLAKELHPDLNPGDKRAEERFKRATAAYNLLNDPAQKGRFDRGEINGDGHEVMRPFKAKPYAGYGQSAGVSTSPDLPSMEDLLKRLNERAYENGPRPYSPGSAPAGPAPRPAARKEEPSDFFSDLFGSGDRKKKKGGGLGDLISDFFG